MPTNPSAQGAQQVWGELDLTGITALSGRLPVDGSGVTQPISGSVSISGSVTLPTGASTSAKQDTGNTSLATIAGAVAGTEVQVDVLTMPVTAVTGTFFQATQPISAAALPLPADAATQTTLAALNTKVTACNTGAVVVSSAPTTAVTGTFFQATQPVSAVSLPLPTGAALEAGNLATIAGKDFATQTTLSALNTKVTACNTGAVVVTSAPTTAVTGTFWQTTQPISGTLTDGGSGKTLKSAALSLTATGTVIAAVPTKRLKVYAVKVICSAALSINWRDGASTALEGVQSIAINGGYAMTLPPPAFLFATTAGNSLDMVITGVGTAAGMVSYWDNDDT